MPKINNVHTIGQVAETKYIELVGKNGPYTVIIPNDNTIPQITEGTQILSLSITPKKIGNKIRITSQIYISELTNIGDLITCAIFKNSDANAISSGSVQLAGLNTGNMYLSKEYTTTDLNLLTFSLRVGNDIGNVTVNGVMTSIANDIRDLGNTVVTYLKLEEITQ